MAAEANIWAYEVKSAVEERWKNKYPNSSQFVIFIWNYYSD
jgi:hypothetical protein